MIPQPTLSQKLVVLVPTLIVSALLAHWGMSVLARVLVGLGVGMLLIALVALRRERQQ